MHTLVEDLDPQPLQSHFRARLVPETESRGEVLLRLVGLQSRVLVRQRIDLRRIRPGWQDVESASYRDGAGRGAVA